MIRLVVLVLVIGLAAGYQNVNRNENVGICNGNKTPIKKFPYVASLKVMNTFFGAGVILNKWWILTSAFSVNWWEPRDLEFRVGSAQYDDKGLVLKVEKVVCHDQYNGGWDYNIALVKTEKPINHKAVKLGSGELPAGTSVKIAGWGSTEQSSYEPSKYLLSTSLTVLDWKRCNETYSPDLTSRMMCTSIENVGPCEGDFGDPLIYNDDLYGFYTGTKDYKDSPRIYTDVTAYADWIQSIINP